MGCGMNDTGYVALVDTDRDELRHRIGEMRERFYWRRDFPRASHPRELDQINQDELEAAMAPIPDLVDQLEALAPVWCHGFRDHGTDELAR